MIIGHSFLGIDGRAPQWHLSIVKEDVLEQLVDDYLQTRGYFTKHNVKFRPSRNTVGFDPQHHSNFSDIDVIGINPKEENVERVVAVSCKSWQSGFDVKSWINALDTNSVRSGREAWKFFRELKKPIWQESFLNRMEQLSTCKNFTYITAVTKINGNENEWNDYVKNCFYEISRIEINAQVLTSIEIAANVLSGDSTLNRMTLASSDIGRLLQVLSAAGYSLELKQKKKRDDHV